MKTLKKLALAVTLMVVHSAMAANNYTGTKLITTNVNGAQVNYQCYIRGAHVLLYNKASERYWVNDENIDYKMKDGSPVPYNADGYPESINSELFVKEQAKAKYIVTSRFTVEEKALLKGHTLLTIMVVPSDGKVSEVAFHFVNTSLYQQIPLSTFVKIEQQLKQQLYYHKTALGKQMNYDIVSWTEDFTYPIANPNPTPSPSPE